MIIGFLARWDVRRQIREGENLLRSIHERGADEIETELYRWRDGCEIVIKTYFGEDHFLFHDITHTGVGVGVEAISPGAFEVRRDYTAIYREGIEVCLHVLRDCQSEIKYKGLIKHKIRAAFEYLAFLAVLLTILVQVGFRYLGNDETNVGRSLQQSDSGFVTMQVDKGQAELTRKALENWLQDNDETVTKRLDSMMGEWNSRGMLQSGMAKTELARFRDSCHRQRDYVRDSFYRAYSLQGGDTTKLKYRR